MKKHVRDLIKELLEKMKQWLSQTVGPSGDKYGKPLLTYQFEELPNARLLTGKLLLSLVALGFVVACAPRDNVDSSRLAFQARVQPQPNPNEYSVALSWSNESDPGAWIVQRSEGESSSEPLVTLESKQTRYEDKRVEPGKHYRYILGINGSSYHVVGEAEVTIPRDLEIRGEQTLTGFPHVNRLFLREGAALVMDGKDLRIEVDEIISENGLVTSFAPGQTATSEAPGRAGGKFSIRARSGKGALTVIARGENGGKGSTGRTGAPGLKGGPGGNGLCGYNILDGDVVCGRFTPKMLAQLREAVARGGRYASTNQYMLSGFYCKSQTQDGAPGSRGGTGGKGGQGAPGGNSGTVFVEIEDPSAIQVKALVIPGSGGRGGEGGQGGIGGLGGDPGAPDHLALCRSASPGAQGPVGATGPVGDIGPDGSTERYCLHLGQSSSGDCQGF